MSLSDNSKFVIVGSNTNQNYSIHLHVLLENDNLSSNIKLVITNTTNNNSYSGIFTVFDKKYDNIYNNFICNYNNLIYTNNNVNYETYIQSYYMNCALFHNTFEITETETEHYDLIFQYTYLDLTYNNKTNYIYLQKINE